MRLCKTCGKDFSREKQKGYYCGSCRGHRQKKPCPDCGKPMTRRSKRCAACAAKSRIGTGDGSRHSKGYRLVPAHGHPRAHNGYVLEHILVMEQTLGRLLVPGENVHHINGIRDDNRPENLELWTKPQPTGIRAEDAYKWALEMIERYGSLFEDNAA